MGAIQFDKNSGSLEITYGGREAPWTGIDSSAPNPYIHPTGMLKSSQGFINIDNSLVATNWNQVSDIVFAAGTQYIVGFGDLNGIVFAVTFDTSTRNVTVTSYPSFFSPVDNIALGSVNLPVYAGPPAPGSLTFKNVNGICFFSWSGCPYIIQHNNVSVSILTSYLGCSYLNELNGRLLAMDVWQSAYTTGNTVVNFTPTIETANSTVTVTGTTTLNTTALTVPTSLVLPSSLSVVISVNFAYYVSFNSSSTGSVVFNLQFSADNGVTWVTEYTTTTSTYANGYQYYTFNIPAPPNINTLQIRGQAVITVANAGSTVVQVNVYNSTITIPAYLTPVTTEYPYQFAWSGPSGAYQIFNPLDQYNHVTGAGFNNLPDVEDYITGYFNVGPTGYIVRGQGITEVSPLSNGILPFDFNHMWAAHKGIGSVYPSTVFQYGSVGGFLADTGIYTLGYEGINEISGKAKSAIYQELILNNNPRNLASGVGPVQINGESFLAYCLAADVTVTGGSQNIVIYLYNFTQKEWYRFVLVGTAFAGLSFLAANGPDYKQIVNSLYLFTYATGTAGQINTFFTYGLPIAGTYLNEGLPEATLYLPPEELKFERDVTIDAVGLYYKATSPDTALSVQVSVGTDGNPNFLSSFLGMAGTVPALTTGQWQYTYCYPITAPVTVKQPQLAFRILNSSGAAQSFVLGKAVLFGSMDKKQRDVST